MISLVRSVCIHFWAASCLLERTHVDIIDIHTCVCYPVLENHLDVLAATESFHNYPEDSSILRATPWGYPSRDSPRPLQCEGGLKKGGGGIVVFLLSSLRVSQIHFAVINSSFEAACLSKAAPVKQWPSLPSTDFVSFHLLFNSMKNFHQCMSVI